MKKPTGDFTPPTQTKIILSSPLPAPNFNGVR